MVAWQEEQEKQMAVHEQNDEETRDKLIEEADLPLSVRLYKKGNAAVNEQLNRAIQSNSKGKGRMPANE